MNWNSICVVSVKHSWSLKQDTQYEFIIYLWEFSSHSHRALKNSDSGELLSIPRSIAILRIIKQEKGPVIPRSTLRSIHQCRRSQFSPAPASAALINHQLSACGEKQQRCQFLARRGKRIRHIGHEVAPFFSPRFRPCIIKHLWKQ